MTTVLSPCPQDAPPALHSLFRRRIGLVRNPPRSELVGAIVEAHEALVLPCGALATWGRPECTGRIPDDTYIVRSGTSAEDIDWASPHCLSMERVAFDALFADAAEILGAKERFFLMERAVGAEPRSALPLRLLTDSPLTALFADNMFLPSTVAEMESIFRERPFTMLVLPSDRIAAQRYKGVLRESGGKTVDLCVAMDFERRLGLVYGSSYCGCVKKLMFTAMNHLLPEAGILPLHCAATEDRAGCMHLFLGLSGTGKTTLSADPRRSLIGDDEHLWSEEGIANMENGCYAKLIRLSKEKEPDIYDAVFGGGSATLTLPSPFKGRGNSGVIIENAMVYPDGSVDLSDERLTENSRASYPLAFLRNAKESQRGGHPRTILFLTADAQGVLPPIAKLTVEQALLWFLMGYTSKLAGTETGITKPKSTFSRFFGGPFMPRKPVDYLRLFEEKVRAHGTDVYLVNTGWSGGPYGIGKRMDITLTRRLVDAALGGELRGVPYWEYQKFHLLVPQACPGVDSTLLNPKKTWADSDAYDRTADALAREFAAAFDKFFRGAVPVEVERECPGK